MCSLERQSIIYCNQGFAASPACTKVIKGEGSEAMLLQEYKSEPITHRIAGFQAAADSQPSS